MRLRAQHILLGSVIVTLLTVNIIATRNAFTAPYPGHNDFLTPVTATTAFWRDGLNPYGQETTDRIWALMFGREPEPFEDPGYFVYPFYATFMILPFAYVSYDWASAIWMVLLEVTLIVALLLTLDLFRYRPRPLMLAGLILWALFYYPAARGLILGQLGHVTYLLQVLTLWALARDRDGLAGVALGISTFKPQMGYLLVPFLLIWALQSRRWLFIRNFFLTFVLLLAAAFAIYPSWFGDWLHRLTVYRTYTLGSPVWIITQFYLGLGSVGEWALTLALYGLVLWSWYTVLVQRHSERLLWVIIWTMTLTHIVAPRTAAPHFVVFTLPLIFYFRTWARQVPRRAGLYIGLTLLAFLVIPWVHFLTTVGGVVKEAEHPTTHLLLPLTMLVILWGTRRMWWNAPPIITAESPRSGEVSLAT